MAKFVSVPLEILRKVKDLAMKNKASSLLDAMDQHTELFLNGVLKNENLLKEAEAKGTRILRTNDWRRIVQAASMEKPLGVKNTPKKLGGKYDFSGMQVFPEDQVSAIRGKGGVVQETLNKKGKVARKLNYADNRTPKVPSKKTRRVEQEMDLASRRAELRTRARTNNPVDVIDYLLSR